MARFIFALNQSLDGYVDHDAFAPDPTVFQHFIDDMRGLAGALYGRRMYEIMGYWDEDQDDWTAPERDYAAAWRAQRKWVASRTLTSVGPNAVLLQGGLEAAARRLKSEMDGEIEVAGPKLAGELTALGLIDEYRLYIHPVVLGAGAPFFTGPRPRLRLKSTDPIGDEVIRLTYVPAD